MAVLIWMALSITELGTCFEKQCTETGGSLSNIMGKPIVILQTSINVEIDDHKNKSVWASFSTSEAQVSKLGSPHSSSINIT